MGTQGYAAPEYIMTGHLTTMSDVFSFGVVLLELITGKRSVDNTRPGREQSLIEWAKPLMRDIKNVERLMDTRLEGQFSIKGAQRAVSLAYKCLSHRPKPRPTMNYVVQVLESLQGFEDTFEKPFVYVVPDDKESFQSDQDSDKRKRHRRRRIKVPNTLVAHSDSIMYKKLR